jgi:hypothetical protein
MSDNFGQSIVNTLVGELTTIRNQQRRSWPPTIRQQQQLSADGHQINDNIEIELANGAREDVFKDVAERIEAMAKVDLTILKINLIKNHFPRNSIDASPNSWLTNANRTRNGTMNNAPFAVRRPTKLNCANVSCAPDNVNTESNADLHTFQRSCVFAKFVSFFCRNLLKNLWNFSCIQTIKQSFAATIAAMDSAIMVIDANFCTAHRRIHHWFLF